MMLIALLIFTDCQIEYLTSHFIQGQYRNVKIVDSFAYFCTCRGLEIWDITDATNPQMLGTAITEAWATSIDVSGDYAYIADQFNGLCIFGISDPSNPFRVGHYDTEGCTEYVMVQDTLAYLADGDRGLVIVNVSDPIHPFYVGSWTQGNYYSFTVFVADSLAYLGNISNQPLKIISVANAANPYLIANFPQVPHPTSNIICAHVVDTLAFLAGTWWLGSSYSHFLVANVADPTNPLLISNVHLTNPALGVVVHGSCAYVSNQDRGVRILDISDPVTPVEVGHFGESVHYGYGCAVRDTLLIVPQSTEGFTIADISEPSNPVQIFNKVNFLYSAFAVRESQRHLYLYGGVCASWLFHSTLSFIDMNDIVNPIVRSQMNVLGWWNQWMYGPGLVTDDSCLVFGLMRSGDDFVGVVDITDIAQPQLIRFEPGTTAGPLALVYPRVYAGHDEKLMIGDVNATPLWTDSIALPAFCHGLAIDDSVGYAACRFNLSILNLNTGSMITSYFHGHPYAGCNGGVIINFPYLYMSFNTVLTGMIYNGFLIFDVSDPSMPSLLSEIMTLEPMPWYIMVGHAKSCYLDDTLFYLCRGRAGFDIYSVNDPLTPTLVLTQATPYSCDAVHVLNDTIFVLEGLSVEIYRLVETGIQESPLKADHVGLAAIEAYPDPFKTNVSIAYSLQSLLNKVEPGVCFLDIYDVSGRLVKSFGPLAEQSGQITWYGKDDAGRNLHQGVYFVNLNAEGKSYVQKVVLIR
jgi:hypothetical protein